MRCKLSNVLFWFAVSLLFGVLLIIYQQSDSYKKANQLKLNRLLKLETERLTHIDRVCLEKEKRRMLSIQFSMEMHAEGRLHQLRLSKTIKDQFVGPRPWMSFESINSVYTSYHNVWKYGRIALKQPQLFSNANPSNMISETEFPHWERIIRNNLIYIPQWKQMWCLPPKTGSTSWSKAIIQRLNADEPTIYIDENTTTPLQVILKDNYGLQQKKSFLGAAFSSEVSKILTVRNPFRRLSSVYLDKLSNRRRSFDSAFFYQTYGFRISRSFGNRTRRKLLKQREPTFEEFISYIISSKHPLVDFDEHWMPIWMLCGLCHIKYDHIIVLEELPKNWKEYLSLLQFPTNFKFPHENTNSLGNISGNMSHVSLFGQLSTSKKTRLLSQYLDDFRLFQYTPL